jgi:hypothetical protein
MLLGSAFAIIGALAKFAIVHATGVGVADGMGVGVGPGTQAITVMGVVPGVGVGIGFGLTPYRLFVATRFRPVPEIHVLEALLPCKNEYGYQVPLGD